VKSSGLNFNAALSSELLEVAKPEPEMYLKGLKLLKLKPEECMTVAAHYYDVVGAKNV
jgi:HAD superfamily hydrolase (TIGR01493 family)